jgi:hypothetical protein
MRKIPVTVLVLVWIVGIAMTWVEQRARLEHARAMIPRGAAYVRARHEADEMRRRDSALAFARAPIARTSTGESVRAVAYASAPVELSRGSSWLQLVGVVLMLWVFKIPLAVLAFTIAWVFARYRPPGSGTPPPATT